MKPTVTRDDGIEISEKIWKSQKGRFGLVREVGVDDCVCS
jgi:hypothetical protein